jgi:hypothetical protein
MEVKNPLIVSVRTTVRTGFELFIIAFVLLLPLAVTAFATMYTNLSIWEIFTCGIGTLIWWHICWFAFWIII